MTMSELKDFIMEEVVDNDESIPDVKEEDVNTMTRAEMKEVVKVAVMMKGSESDVIAPILKETVGRLSTTELKDVIMEVVDNEKPEAVVIPLVQDAINQMSVTEVREFIAETVMKEADEADEVIAPLVEKALDDMKKTELKHLVMETIVEAEEDKTTLAPEVKEEREEIINPQSVDDINKMTMQELRDFIERNTLTPTTTEKPKPREKLEVKDGMLFKNGKTMKELKADNMGMTMKEFVGRKEGLKMREIMKVSEGVSVEEMIAMKNDVRWEK